MQLNSSFSLDRMTDSYTRPTEEEAVRLIEELDRAEKSGLVTFSFAEVLSEERVPWALDERLVDCLIEPTKLGCSFLFESEGKSLEVFGSGVHTDSVRATAHACSETMERLAARFEGQADLRPTRHSAWSTRCDDWVDVRKFGDTFRDLAAHRSGEAFHAVSGEATRAALCELIEKDTVTKILGGASGLKVTRITSQAAALSTAASEALRHFSTEGYDLAYFHVRAFDDVHVVLAVARHADLQAFRACAKGAGADFTLQHAVSQATSEIGRAFFTGRASAMRTPVSAASEITSGTLTPASVDTALLLFPESRSLFEPLFHLREASCRADKGSRETLLKTLATETEDILIVPLACNLFGVSGIATKLLVPGFSEVPHIATMMGLEFLNNYQ